MNSPSGVIAPLAMHHFRSPQLTRQTEALITMRPIVALLVVSIMIISALTALGLLLFQMGLFD